MAKLNQINALVTGKKGEAEKAVTEMYKLLQKETLFDGRERTYRPLDEESGEKLPAEKQKVQYTVNDLVRQAQEKWTEIWDLVATQDRANQEARADIKINGQVIVEQVPVTTLLYLDKQINDLETFISKIPTPDPSEEWSYDANTDLLKTSGSQTSRSKKVPRNHVKYEATKEHPAQVELYYEDVQVGTWTQILYSGRMMAKRKNDILRRIKELKDAIKLAREEANLIEAKRVAIAGNIFAYLLDN